LPADISFEFTKEYRWSLHAADVMDSMETGTIRRIDGNVKNKGLITNLLEGAALKCLPGGQRRYPSLPYRRPAVTVRHPEPGQHRRAGTGCPGIVEKDKKKISSLF